MQLLAVVLGEGNLCEKINSELQTGLHDLMPVFTAQSPTAVLEELEKQPTVKIPVLVIAPLQANLDSTITILRQNARLAKARILIVTDKLILNDISQAMDIGLIEAIYTDPWRTGALGKQARNIVSQYLLDKHPEDKLAQTLAQSSFRPVERRDSRLLRFQEMDEQEVVNKMFQGVEKVLGPRPRVILPAGTRITRQGHHTDTIFLAFRGSVALERETPLGTVIMHHASTGPLVGLLSFGQQRVAFFTSRATSELEGICLTLEQIDHVLSDEPLVSAALAALAIRSLDRRLRRAEQIQMEKIELNAQLEQERAQLQATLEELKSTREELVSRERFATLGEISAGVAHEINNPVAALQRATEHLEEDINDLVTTHPQHDFVQSTIQDARNRKAISTKEERQLRRELTTLLGDAELAYKFVAVGITDTDQAHKLMADKNHTLELLQTAAGIGSALRNLDMSANRIKRLVQSLKSYSRPDELPVDGIDINQSIEDTIRLTKHRLKDIEVETIYGNLPPVRCHPGQLDQVWTNIIVNSADALEGHGKITIITDMYNPNVVRIRLADNGSKGIAPEVLPRIFEPRFTTKHGRVSFGLGMGLSMVKAIIERHDGTIEMSSHPGKTQTVVLLPVTGPKLKE